jgi:hypothetical protein
MLSFVKICFSPAFLFKNRGTIDVIDKILIKGSHSSLNWTLGLALEKGI